MKIGRDERDTGKHYACCAICGCALRVAAQWWCADCGREFGLTDYMIAPGWAQFLVLSERKRRHEFHRDYEAESWEGIGEAEDDEEESE